MAVNTMERTFSVDSDLARRAERKLHRYGMNVEEAVSRVLSIVISVRGKPAFLSDSFGGHEDDGGAIPLDFEVSDKRMRKRRNASVVVKTGMENGLFTAIAESIGLDAFAESQAALTAEVKEQLAVLWREYALADDKELTASARRIKRNLLSVFEEVRDA